MHRVRFGEIGRGLVVLVLMVACAGGTPSGDESPSPEVTPTSETAGEGAPVANACPAEGCQVRIVDVTQEGEELRITWEANYLPEISRNHVHVYWDIYTADQVSDDAESRGVQQGDWHPTDAYPTYLTESAASVANRGDSTTICVTAGNGDHVVLDSSLVACRGVGEMLES